jgi:hypothetical protein
LRVTPLTDRTHDSIRMANPGTTFDAGVIPRCLVLARRLCCSVHGRSARCFKLECGGVWCQYYWPRGQWGSCKAVVPQAVERQPRPSGGTGGRIRVLRVVPGTRAGRKALTGTLTGLNTVRATRLNGGRVAGPCERWLSLQIGFRSESGKRFGAGLATGAPNLSRVQGALVEVDELRPPITWGRWAV